MQLAAGKQVQMEGGSAARAGMAAAVAAKAVISVTQESVAVDCVADVAAVAGAAAGAVIEHEGGTPEEAGRIAAEAARRSSVAVLTPALHKQVDPLVRQQKQKTKTKNKTISISLDSQSIQALNTAEVRDQDDGIDVLPEASLSLGSSLDDTTSKSNENKNRPWCVEKVS